MVDSTADISILKMQSLYIYISEKQNSILSMAQGAKTHIQVHEYSLFQLITTHNYLIIRDPYHMAATYIPHNRKPVTPISYQQVQE